MTTKNLYTTSRYTESQSFTQPWIYIPFVIAIVIFAIVGMVQPMPDNKTLFLGLGLPIGMMLVMVMFLRFIRLDTVVDSQGIHVKFRPFHIKTRTYKWSEIEHVYTREYRPIYEYGGWGIRYTWKNGKAFNVSGKKGVQLELKNGKRIMIGSTSPEAIEPMIERYFKK